MKGNWFSAVKILWGAFIATLLTRQGFSIFSALGLVFVPTIIGAGTFFVWPDWHVGEARRCLKELENMRDELKYLVS